MLYNAILAPNFDYCDVIWGTCHISHNHKVQVMQNRAAKFITCVEENMILVLRLEEPERKVSFSPCCNFV